MTPQQMARFGIFYLREAVLAILEEAPEKGYTHKEIIKHLNISAFRNPDGHRRERYLVQGTLFKLEKEGLIQQYPVASNPDYWKLKQ